MFSRICRHFLGLFLVSLVVLACTSQPARAPTPGAFAVPLVDETVALYSYDRRDAPRCTAVWVGSNSILTAAHCIEVGEDLLYSTHNEYTGVYVEPKQLHPAMLIKADLFHDLALYHTELDTPQHTNAQLAWSRPLRGEFVYFAGHPAGITWSFRQGRVAAYREIQFEDDYSGPWMQVSAPIYFGDSGGGAFNSDGELVGIVHSMATKVPDVGFCVQLDTIREFLQ